MQKRNRTNRIDDERKRIKKSFFVKSGGGMRFEWLERFHYWWLGARSFTRSIFRVAAAKQGIALIGSVLLTCFIMSAFYTQAGEFVVRVEHPGENKLVISDTKDFSERLIVLNGEAIPNADNISIYDIDPKVAEIDGEHNGIDYIAYTYYVKNISQEELTYTYNLSIRRSTKGIEEAVWVMIYHNGEQQIFAMENKEGGAEIQQSSYKLPFEEDAMEKEAYSYDEKTGVYTLTTKPFAASNVVAMAQRDNIAPEEIDKFTVVIWLEGEDPECINDILGGSIEMAMKLKY